MFFWDTVSNEDLLPTDQQDRHEPNSATSERLVSSFLVRKPHTKQAVNDIEGERERIASRLARKV